MYCVCTVYILFMYFKNIKHGSHGTIHTFKNYFAIVFSIFNFRNNLSVFFFEFNFLYYKENVIILRNSTQ